MKDAHLLDEWLLLTERELQSHPLGKRGEEATIVVTVSAASIIVAVVFKDLRLQLLGDTMVPQVAVEPNHVLPSLHGPVVKVGQKRRKSADDGGLHEHTVDVNEDSHSLFKLAVR